jgi:hypothetical protein
MIMLDPGSPISAVEQGQNDINDIPLSILCTTRGTIEPNPHLHPYQEPTKTQVPLYKSSHTQPLTTLDTMQ